MSILRPSVATLKGRQLVRTKPGVNTEAIYIYKKKSSQIANADLLISMKTRISRKEPQYVMTTDPTKEAQICPDRLQFLRDALSTSDSLSG